LPGIYDIPLVFWLQVLLPLSGGLTLSLVIEGLLKPSRPALVRPWRSFCVHVGLWTLLFCIYLVLTQRPYFSTLLTSATLLLLVLVSNAKYRALREPFVYADFEYFTDTLKHPRLFLPYFGLGRLIGVNIVFYSALYMGLAFESGLTTTTPVSAVVAGLIIICLIGAVLLWMGTHGLPPLKFDAADDIHHFGFLDCLWRYAWAERVKPDLGGTFRFSSADPVRMSGTTPHFVVVQSESFFDARRLHLNIHPSVMADFDNMRASAAQHGQLHVPAWGGNTARSEFSFLTGLSGQQIGVHRFNPHRKLSQHGIPSIASFLKQQGYRTICVHPYPASFYSRHAAFPALGFDEFVDIRAFANAERYGPYISDKAVAGKACALLDAADGPLLLFIITMENHGPLHLESIRPGDVHRLYTSPPNGTNYDDLTVYVRHLVNAGAMMQQLRGYLEQNARDAWLCWYGDHVPILPSVYEQTGFADGRTDYFIWGKSTPIQPTSPSEMHVKDLASTLLRHAGMEPR
jgi:hypothetical protein